jgi:hypothetical protein
MVQVPFAGNSRFASEGDAAGGSDCNSAQSVRIQT